MIIDDCSRASSYLVVVGCCLLLVLAGCASDSPGGTEAEKPTQTSQTETTQRPTTTVTTDDTPTPTKTTTRTPDTPEAVTVRYAISTSESVQQNYTTTAREAIESWDSGPEGTDIDFEYTPDPDAADLHIAFEGIVQTCGGQAAQEAWYYCTLDNSTAEDTTVVVSGIYTKADMDRILRTIAGFYAGYENPATAGGFADLQTSPPQYLDPWPTKSEVVVNLSVETESTRAWAPLIEASLDYWDAAETGYGNYTENFVFRPDAERADVTVSIVEDISACGYEIGSLVGCANYYGRDVLAEPVTDIRIEAGYTNETTVDIIKHEFGHVYGRNHGQEPTDVMSERIVNATLLPKLDAGNRTNPYRENPIEVFVDYDSFDHPRDEIRFQVGKAVSYYDVGSSPHVSDALEVTLTRNRSAAEIVVDEGQITFCEGGSGAGSCGIAYGSNEDSDPNFEYYSFQNITIQGLDTPTIGWHVGYWMAFTVGGATSPDELPAPFRNADYEKRTNWWR